MNKEAHDEAYNEGVKLALQDAGLLKKGAMDPIVQKGIQQRRTSATAGGNRYAGGWSPNVPKTPTEKAMKAPSLVGGKPKLPPVDYSAAAGKASRYTKQISGQGAWTRK